MRALALPLSISSRSFVPSFVSTGKSIPAPALAWRLSPKASNAWGDAWGLSPDQVVAADFGLNCARSNGLHWFTSKGERPEGIADQISDERKADHSFSR